MLYPFRNKIISSFFAVIYQLSRKIALFVDARIFLSFIDQQATEMNLLKQIIEPIDFQCPICCEHYNDSTRFPMMMCSSQHSCCLTCLNERLFKGKKEDESINCPFCKTIVKKENTQRFRLLNETRINNTKIEEYSKHMESKVDELNRSHLLVNDFLLRQQEKSDLLLKNYLKLEQTWRNRIDSENIRYDDLIQHNQQKISFIEAQLIKLKQHNQDLKAKRDQQKRDIQQLENKLTKTQKIMNNHKERYRRSLLNLRAQKNEPCCLLLKSSPTDYTAKSARQILATTLANFKKYGRSKSINDRYSITNLQQDDQLELTKNQLLSLTKSVEYHIKSHDRYQERNKFCNINRLVTGLVMQGLSNIALLFCNSSMSYQLNLLFFNYEKYVQFYFLKSSSNRPPNKRYIFIETARSNEEDWFNSFTVQKMMIDYDDLQENPILSKKKRIQNLKINQSLIEGKIITYFSMRYAQENVKQFEDENLKLNSLIERLNANLILTTEGKGRKEVQNEKKPSSTVNSTLSRFQILMQQMESIICSSNSECSVPKQQLEKYFKSVARNQIAEQASFQNPINLHWKISDLLAEEKRLKLIDHLQLRVIQIQKLKDKARSKIQHNNKEAQILLEKTQNVKEESDQQSISEQDKKQFMTDQKQKREQMVAIIAQQQIIPQGNFFLKSLFNENTNNYEKNKERMDTQYLRILTMVDILSQNSNDNRVNCSQMCNIIIFYLNFLSNPSFRARIKKLVEDHPSQSQKNKRQKREIQKNMLTAIRQLQKNRTSIAEVPLSQRNQKNAPYMKLKKEKIQIEKKVSNFKNRYNLAKLAYECENPLKILSVFLTKILEKIQKADNFESFTELLFGFFQCRVLGYSQSCPPLAFLQKDYCFVGKMSSVLQKMKEDGKKFGYHFDQDNRVAICHFEDVRQTIFDIIQKKHGEVYAEWPQLKEAKQASERTTIGTDQPKFKKKEDQNNLDIHLSACSDENEKNRIRHIYENEYLNLTKTMDIKKSIRLILEYYYSEEHPNVTAEQFDFILSQLKDYESIKQAYMKINSFDISILEDLADQIGILKREWITKIAYI